MATEYMLIAREMGAGWKDDFACTIPAESVDDMRTRLDRVTRDQLVSSTPVNAVAAVLSTALAGTNNDLDYTAATKGVAGNSITIAYVNPGTETATESVSVTGTAISVTLRSVSSVLSTATQVKTAIDAHAGASALVTVANKSGNDGTGNVIALTATAMTGGVDGTTGRAGEARYDTSYLYVCVAAQTVAGTNWRRVSLGSAY